jgi:hypothetical protein
MRRALIALLLGSPAFADCLFRAFVPGARGNETAEDYLARVDPANFSPVGNAEKKSAAVYRIKLSDEREYTVRVESVRDEANFESFAAAFARSAPGIEATPVRRFEGEDAKRIARKIAKTDRGFSDNFGRNAEESPNFVVTLSPYYKSLKTGEDIFKAKDIWLPDDGTVANVERVLSPAVIGKVADLWAINTTLGIKDFHSANWLSQGNQVLGIDFASTNATFLEGRKDLEGPIANPFIIGGGLKPQMRDFLQSRMSREMKEFLRTLTSSKLRTLAEQHGLQATNAQIEGMIARARLIAGG